MKFNIKTTYLALAIFATLSGIGVVLTAPESVATGNHNTAAVAEALNTNIQNQNGYRLKTDIPLTAKSAFVYDISSDTVLFSKNADTQLPLASLTKIPMVLVASKYINPETDNITIKESDLATEGDSGLLANDVWNARKLIDFTLMTSSNDGATAIARTASEISGIPITTLLKNLTTKLNLDSTYFVNETGLDVSSAFSGAYGSARDYAKILRYAYKNDRNLFYATSKPTATFIPQSKLIYKAKNTNHALYSLPGIVFGKTGFTDLAGGNLAIVAEIEPNHPIIIVVLGSTFKGRFDDVSLLWSDIIQQNTQ